MKALLELARALAPPLEAAALHGCRLFPVAILCPFLGGPFAPSVVRASLALGLGAWAWAAAGARPFTGSGLQLLTAAALELSLGACLGVLATVPFEAARAGGRLVDTLRGATLAELHVAPLRQSESACGDLLVWSLLASAASGGGDRLVVSALLQTFVSLPAGSAPATAPLLHAGLAGAGELAACAFAIGAPAAAGILVADLALALATRAVPGLLGGAQQPARAALGLAAVALPAAAVGGRLAASVALSAASLAGAAGRGGVLP